MNDAMRLLKGSKNLDQMRDEINDLVRILVGILQKCSPSHYGKFHSEEFYSCGVTRFNWIFWLGNSNGSVYVQINLQTNCCGVWGEALKSGKDNHTDEMKKEWLAGIHDGLSTFVGFVFKSVPSAEVVAESILAAADKF